VQQISFIEFIVRLEGIEMELDRVCTLAEWPESASHCNIQVFLSFVTF
jgi:hypothetical protein